MKDWEKQLDRIDAILASVAESQKEAVKRQEAADKRQKEADKWLEDYKAENRKGLAENKKWMEDYKRENREWMAENKKWMEDYKAENRKAFGELRQNISGISDSNGMVAEEYFYRTLDESMTFGGYHFDRVDKNLNSKLKGKDGKECRMELDILMVNDVAVCMIEAKYRARKGDVVELAEVKVEKFRKLFPLYANHKLYLGIGAMAFEKGVEAEAKARGIGIMRANGDAVEVDDANLKAY